MNEIRKPTYLTLPTLDYLKNFDENYKQMDWYRTSEHLHDLLASIQEFMYDFHLKMITQEFRDEAFLKRDTADYLLMLTDELWPLVQSRAGGTDTNILGEGIHSIRRKMIAINNQQIADSFKDDIKGFFMRLYRFLQEHKILPMLDNLDDLMAFLIDSIDQCSNMIRYFVEQTSFIDASYRVKELRRLINTVDRLTILLGKNRTVCSLCHSLVIEDRNVRIQEHIKQLLIARVYIQWVSFPFQSIVQDDFDILRRTQEFLREHEHGSILSEQIHSSWKFFNVHFQKVQALPIIFSSDQRFEMITRLCRSLKGSQLILNAASKLELNVACKLTMNLLIKTDFIEHTRSQNKIFTSIDFLDDLNVLFFAQTILSRIFDEIGSCKTNLDQIENEFRLNEAIINNSSEVSTENQLCIDSALMKLDEFRGNIPILFATLHENFRDFEANGWLNDILTYSERHEENFIYDVIDRISEIYCDEFHSKTINNGLSNVLNQDNKQLKTDVLRGRFFEKFNLNDIYAPYGRTTFSLVQLVYPKLFAQNTLIYVFKTIDFLDKVRKALAVPNDVDLFVNSKLTEMIVIDKRQYNRYLFNPSGVAHLNKKLIVTHLIVDHPRFQTKDMSPLINQISSDSQIDSERKLIPVAGNIDLLHFAIPCLVQKMSSKSTLNIEAKDLREISHQTDLWFIGHRQSGTIRFEERLVDESTQKDLEFFRKIIDQVKHIFANVFTTNQIDISQISQLVNRLRQDLERHRISGLNRRINDELEMCIPKEATMRASIASVVEAKKFRFPVLNRLMGYLNDSQTKFHVFISTVIHRLHHIQSKFFELLFDHPHQTNKIDMDIYANAHRISKLLISIVRFIMENIDTYGFKVGLEDFTGQMTHYHDEIWKLATSIGKKNNDRLESTTKDDFILFTAKELDDIIESTSSYETNSRPEDRAAPAVLMAQPSKDAEKIGFELQEQFLSEIENELELLRQSAKKKDLTKIQYTIALLLMDINEIRQSQKLLNDAHRLHWKRLPKQLQRLIASESIKQKKIDMFNIKRVKDEHLIDVSNDMMRKTIKHHQYSRSISFQDDQGRELKKQIEDLYDAKSTELEAVSTFLNEYFQRENHEYMWRKVEKSIYELRASNERIDETNQSTVDNLKSLMATFIYLDSNYLAEICRELLHSSQERHYLPQHTLDTLRTKTLTSLIEKRVLDLKQTQHCDKSHLVEMILDEDDVQSCHLIQLYPLLVRLKKRHEQLNINLQDLSSYKQVISIHASFLRPSDCIAFLFPDLSELFLESLELDRLDFNQVEAFKAYLDDETLRQSITELYSTQFSIRDRNDRYFPLLGTDLPVAVENILSFIQDFTRRIIRAGLNDQLRSCGYDLVCESNEYHAYFALEFQALSIRMYEIMQDNLNDLAKEFEKGETWIAARCLKLAESYSVKVAQEIRSLQKRREAIRANLNSSSLHDVERSLLESEFHEVENQYNQKEVEYFKQTNKDTAACLRQLVLNLSKLKRFNTYLTARLRQTIEEQAETHNTLQSMTSNEFYDYLFTIKTALIKMRADEFDRLKDRIKTFINESDDEFQSMFDDCIDKYRFLNEKDTLYRLFERFLFSYRLSNRQLFNAIRNWISDVTNLRNSYAQDIRKDIDQMCISVRSLSESMRTIFNVDHINSITFDRHSLHQMVQDISRVAYQVEKLASATRVVYSPRVLSIHLHHCSSLHAKIAVFLVQLFKHQRTDPNELSDLQNFVIQIEDQSIHWDEHMKSLLMLSRFRLHSDLPGTMLPNDEYSLQEVHQRLSHDYALLEHSLSYRYTHAFSDICSNPAALLDDLERKIEMLVLVNSSKENSTSLIQISYILNVLVHNTRSLLMRILNNPQDSFEIETFQHLQLFVENLQYVAKLNCSSSVERMLTIFLNFVLDENLDNLLKEGILFLQYLNKERKNLIDALSQIRTLLENFVDDYFHVLVDLFEQEKDRQIETLQQSYRASLVSMNNLRRQDISLIENLSLKNVSNDDELDWFKHLVEFLLKAWSQALRLLRSFSGSPRNTNECTCQRLKYSSMSNYLNQEKNHLFQFLTQTIGQFNEKYSSRSMINDVPVVVYLTRLMQIFRLETIRLSLSNFPKHKSDFERIQRIFQEDDDKKFQDVIVHWNESIDNLLDKRKNLRTDQVDRDKQNFKSRIRIIEEKNNEKREKFEKQNRQVTEAISKTKDDLLQIFTEIKMLGRLLNSTGNGQDPTAEIQEYGRLLDQLIKATERLADQQKRLPTACRLDPNVEGKELEQMVSIESVRIEVKKVIYRDKYPNYRHHSRTMWDNRVQLIRRGPPLIKIDGPLKQLESFKPENVVHDLFDSTVKSTADPSARSKESWEIRIKAGLSKDNLWEEMTYIPLTFGEMCSSGGKEISYDFGPYYKSKILVRFTPEITIDYSRTSDHETQEASIKPDDRFAALKKDFPTLQGWEKRTRIESCLKDLDERIRSIERLPKYTFDYPDEPIYQKIPEQDDIKNVPEIEQTKDRSVLEKSSTAMHHHYMKLLSTKYYAFRLSIVENLESVKKVFNEGEFDENLQTMAMKFDNSEVLKEDLNRLTDYFRFDQICSIISTVHGELVKNQAAIEVLTKFQSNLDDSNAHIRKIGYRVKLEDESQDTILNQTIDKLYTNEMNQTMIGASKLIDDILERGRGLQQLMRNVELVYLQVLFQAIGSKQHCETFLSLIDEMKKIEKNESTILDELVSLVEERQREIRSIRNPVSRMALLETNKTVNIQSLMKSNRTSTINKLTIRKENDELISLPNSSLNIELDEMIVDWPNVKRRKNFIEIENQSDENLAFDVVSPNLGRIFEVEPKSLLIENGKSERIEVKILENFKELVVLEETLQIRSKKEKFKIDVNLKIETKKFSVFIDLPLVKTDESSPELFDLNFGTVATGSKKNFQKTFEIENSTSIDLRVKIRRESGAVGRFEIDRKQTSFLLFGFERKSIPVRWFVEENNEDASCFYEIFFRKNLKYRIRCRGKTRPILYKFLYDKVSLPKIQSTIYCEAVLPFEKFTKDILIENSGELDLTLNVEVESKHRDVEIRLSNNESFLESRTISNLIVEFETRAVHRSMENVLLFRFSNNKEFSIYRLIFKTNCGWPELSASSLFSLSDCRVSSDESELKKHIDLRNIGVATMNIVGLKSNLNAMNFSHKNIFPIQLGLNEEKRIEFSFRFEKNRATIAGSIFLLGNFPTNQVEIPIRIKKQIPAVSLSPAVFHCSSIRHESQSGEFSICVSNDGNVAAQIYPESFDNRIFTWKFIDPTVSLSARSATMYRFQLSIKKSAPRGFFCIKIPFFVRFDGKNLRQNRILITGRVLSRDEPIDIPVKFPLSASFLPNSYILRRLSRILRDQNNFSTIQIVTSAFPVLLALENFITNNLAQTDETSSENSRSTQVPKEVIKVFSIFERLLRTTELAHDEHELSSLPSFAETNRPTDIKESSFESLRLSRRFRASNPPNDFTSIHSRTLNNIRRIEESMRSTGPTENPLESSMNTRTTTEPNSVNESVKLFEHFHESVRRKFEDTFFQSIKPNDQNNLQRALDFAESFSIYVENSSLDKSKEIVARLIEFHRSVGNEKSSRKRFVEFVIEFFPVRSSFGPILLSAIEKAEENPNEAVSELIEHFRRRKPMKLVEDHEEEVLSSKIESNDFVRLVDALNAPQIDFFQVLFLLAKVSSFFDESQRTLFDENLSTVAESVFGQNLRFFLSAPVEFSARKLCSRNEVFEIFRSVLSFGNSFCRKLSRAESFETMLEEMKTKTPRAKLLLDEVYRELSESNSALDVFDAAIKYAGLLCGVGSNRDFHVARRKFSQFFLEKNRFFFMKNFPKFVSKTEKKSVFMPILDAMKALEENPKNEDEVFLQLCSLIPDVEKRNLVQTLIVSLPETIEEDFRRILVQFSFQFLGQTMMDDELKIFQHLTERNSRYRSFLSRIASWTQVQLGTRVSPQTVTATRDHPETLKSIHPARENIDRPSTQNQMKPEVRMRPMEKKIFLRIFFEFAAIFHGEIFSRIDKIATFIFDQQNTDVFEEVLEIWPELRNEFNRFSSKENVEFIDEFRIEFVIVALETLRFLVENTRKVFFDHLTDFYRAKQSKNPEKILRCGAKILCGILPDNLSEKIVFFIENFRDAEMNFLNKFFDENDLRKFLEVKNVRNSNGKKLEKLRALAKIFDFSVEDFSAPENFSEIERLKLAELVDGFRALVAEKNTVPLIIETILTIGVLNDRIEYFEKTIANESQQHPVEIRPAQRIVPSRKPTRIDRQELLPEKVESNDEETCRTENFEKIQKKIDEIQSSTDFFRTKSIELSSNDGIQLNETIEFFILAKKLRDEILSAMEEIGDLASNSKRNEIRRLSENYSSPLVQSILDVVQTLEKIENSIDEIGIDFREKFEQIQLDLIEIFGKLTGNENLSRFWKKSSRNDKIEDYEVDEDGQVSATNTGMNFRSTETKEKFDQIQSLLKTFDSSKFSRAEIDLETNFNRLGIHLEHLFEDEPIDSNNEQIQRDFDSKKLEQNRTNFVDRNILLQTNEQTFVSSGQNRLSNIDENQFTFLRLANETEQETPKENSKRFRAEFSSKVIDQLRKNAQISFNQNYKHELIGQLTENCEPEHIPDVQLDRPRYSLLARLTRNIQTAILTRFRSILNRYFVQDDLHFQFVFAVDNSGSMSGRKIRQALNTLIIFMETFHRLEWKFAVLRFGAEQKILKKLDHSSMFEQMSQEKFLLRGQFILESFTTDEKTLPVTALEQIARNDDLFGLNKPTNVKRFVIMITDGISSQNDVQSFNNALRQAHADLYMVCIIPEKGHDSEHGRQATTFAQRVAPSRNQVIEVGDLDKMTKAVAIDLTNLIEQSILNCKTTINTNNILSNQYRIRTLKPMVINQPINQIDSWTKVDIDYSGRAFVSDRRKRIEQDFPNNQDLITFSIDFDQDFQKILDELDQSYSNLDNQSQILINTERQFRQMEQICDSFIIDLVRTMEEHLFPALKPTLSLPDIRGNRLHIPGIVKYLSTQGQYNRIYLNPIGSPKAEYRIALILDQSVSMTGPTYLTAVEILFSMCAALNRLGIDDFNVLTVGKQIQLIKSFKQVYDRLFFQHFRTSLNIDGETTYLADSIFLASQILIRQSSQQNNNGPMFIFVLTDGYDHRSNFLRRILNFVEQQSITVIGLGLGFESNGVCFSFHDWIIAQNPRLISDALVSWSNQQSDGQTPNDSLFHEDQNLVVQGKNGQDYSTTDQVWDDKQNENYFDEFTGNTQRAIDLTFSSNVYQTDLLVEICFVMDCTGSMKKWIDAAKQHIRSIADGIRKEITEKFEKSSILRMGFVAYRDFSDISRFDSIDFRQGDQIEEVEQRIGKQVATGGGDLCEDVQGGLNEALKLSWTKDSTQRVARILVWIGDCPGHTAFCHNQGSKWDAHLNGLPDVPLMIDLIQTIKDRNIFLLLSDFTVEVQFMLENIEKQYIEDGRQDQLRRVKLNSLDTSSLLTEVQQQINTIIASEFM